MYSCSKINRMNRIYKSMIYNRMVIDGNDVYEIDDECERERQNKSEGEEEKGCQK
ncbi:hypothetical protein P261_00203 [Lachnospiraceae bacterium TWA4]|nr:hypothetical protein P261_00203 [Lachnospiraceae bacterium TWA4]